MKRPRQSRRNTAPASDFEPGSIDTITVTERFPAGGGWGVTVMRGPRQRAAFPWNIAKQHAAVADLKAAAERNKAFVWGTYENQRSRLGFAHDDPKCAKRGIVYSGAAAKLARHQLPCGCNRRAAASGRALDLSVALRLAKVREARLLSSEYRNNRAPLEWQCGDGHRFTMSLDDARRGRWCPRCRDSRANRLCAVILEELLEVRFEPEQSPDFLVAASARHGLPGVLRFDGWCASERIAFEHQGPQHAAPVAHHRVGGDGVHVLERAQAKLAKLQRYDAIKADACQGAAYLIVIPDLSANGYAYVNAPAIVDTVVTAVREAIPGERLNAGFEAARERLRGLDEERWERMVQPIFTGSRTRRRVRRTAERRGGRVIKFVGDRRVLLECAQGHRWHAQINNVLTGTWCPVEGRQSRARARRLQVGALRLRLTGLGFRLNWTDSEARARYQNNQTLLPVTRMACGGSFSRRLAKLHAGSRCPQCRNKRSCAGVGATRKGRRKAR